tara:strand:+ start:573 stop:1235 length:663 start_codon:yes stop_codon:yes gene_type:complete
MSIEKEEINELIDKPVKVKKPRTAKQLAADERLREMGKKRAAQRKLDKEKKTHKKNQEDLEINLNKICDVVEDKLDNKLDSNEIIEAQVCDDNKAAIVEPVASLEDTSVSECEPEPTVVVVEPEPVKLVVKKTKVNDKKEIANLKPKKKRVPKKKKVIYYSSNDEETDSDTELVYIKKEKQSLSAAVETKKKRTIKSVVKKDNNEEIKPISKRTNRFFKK